MQIGESEGCELAHAMEAFLREGHLKSPRSTMILYGSATQTEFLCGWSNLNVLVLASGGNAAIENASVRLSEVAKRYFGSNVRLTSTFLDDRLGVQDICCARVLLHERGIGYLLQKSRQQPLYALNLAATCKCVNPGDIPFEEMISISSKARQQDFISGYGGLESLFLLQQQVFRERDLALGPKGLMAKYLLKQLAQYYAFLNARFCPTFHDLLIQGDLWPQTLGRSIELLASILSGRTHLGIETISEIISMCADVYSDSERQKNYALFPERDHCVAFEIAAQRIRLNAQQISGTNR